MPRLMRASAASVALALVAGTASAQRAETTATTEAEDAFGFTIAGETIGLYSDKYARGFSPVNAGNLRLDGLYIDRETEDFTERLFSDVTIRVGATALDAPLPAPSGIADYTLRRPGEEALLSVAGGVVSFGTPFLDVDWTAGGGDGFGLALGASLYPDENYKDGSDGRYHTWFLSPTWTFGGGPRVTAFVSRSRYEDYEAEIAYYTAGAYAPPRVHRGPYLGLPWAGDTGKEHNYGLIVDRARLAGWELKAGVFNSEWRGEREVFQFLDAVTPDGAGNCGAILYPERIYESWSGELQAVRDFAIATDWRASVLLNVRGRDLDVRSMREGDPVEAPGHIGEPAPPLSEPTVAAGPVDRESIRQLMPGASIKLAWTDRLQVQVGVQQADYRHEIEPGDTGLATSKHERPWTGSASASVTLGRGWVAYAAYARGFEDSGTAPNSAANAGEVLPASRTEQWDAGLRWAVSDNTHLIASVFRLERPSRAFDANDVFGLHGLVRNDGVELSFVSRPVDGLSVVAGLLVQDPRVIGAAEGVGPHAVDIPDYSGVLELDYEPAPWRGFGVSLSVASTGRAAGKTDNSVELPAYTTLDVGVRYGFEIRKSPASLRLSVSNLTNEFAWDANDDEGFRWVPQHAFQLVLAADFPGLRH